MGLGERTLEPPEVVGVLLTDERDPFVALGKLLGLPRL